MVENLTWTIRHTSQIDNINVRSYWSQVNYVGRYLPTDKSVR
jgi:hypothetical protein